MNFREIFISEIRYVFAKKKTTTSKCTDFFLKCVLRRKEHKKNNKKMNVEINNKEKQEKENRYQLYAHVAL